MLDVKFHTSEPGFDSAGVSNPAIADTPSTAVMSLDAIKPRPGLKLTRFEEQLGSTYVSECVLDEPIDAN